MSLLQRSKLGLFVAFAGLAACNKTEDGSGLVDFAFNPDAKNFAILAGNDGGNLAGVPVDIQNWKKFVDQGILGKFQIVYYEEKAATTQAVQQAMTQVGQQLEDDSTVLFVYSGHGDQQGILQFTPPTTFKPLGDALVSAAKARNKRAARFYFFNDSCFSGKATADQGQSSVTNEGTLVKQSTIRPLAQIQDGFKGQDYAGGGVNPLGAAVGGGSGGGPGGILGGNGAGGGTGNGNGMGTGGTPGGLGPLGDLIFGGNGNGTGGGMPLTLTQDGGIVIPPNPNLGTDNLVRDASQLAGPNSPFGGLFVVAAASEAETAGDLGAGGGAFTGTLVNVINHYHNQWSPTKALDKNPSIERVFNAALGATTGQAPEYRYYPERIKEEKFFITKGQVAPGPAPGPAPAPGQAPAPAPAPTQNP